MGKAATELNLFFAVHHWTVPISMDGSTNSHRLCLLEPIVHDRSPATLGGQTPIQKLNSYGGYNEMTWFDPYHSAAKKKTQPERARPASAELSENR